MSSFDDMTLGEVELAKNTCLDGKGFSDPDVDPLMLSGAVMWITQRRTDNNLDWQTFKDTVRMSEIKAFADAMEVQAKAETENPTNARSLRAS